jgi:sortase (surface protein transpeptidase)
MIKVQNHSAVICVALIAFLLLGIIYGNNNEAKAQDHNPEEQKGKQEQEDNEKNDDDEDNEDKDDIPLKFEVPIPFP